MFHSIIITVKDYVLLNKDTETNCRRSSIKKPFQKIPEKTFQMMESFFSKISGIGEYLS